MQLLSFCVKFWITFYVVYLSGRATASGCVNKKRRIFPFEIYDTSTVSYDKKVSSTYHRYACGTFLSHSLYLHRLFQKANGKSIPQYAVADEEVQLWLSSLTDSAGNTNIVLPCTMFVSSFSNEKLVAD